MACQPDLLGLGDQVTDGQHQPVFADDDAAALPEIAERAAVKASSGMDERRATTDRKTGSIFMAVILMRYRLDFQAPRRMPRTNLRYLHN